MGEKLEPDIMQIKKKNQNDRSKAFKGRGKKLAYKLVKDLNIFKFYGNTVKRFQVP